MLLQTAGHQPSLHRGQGSEESLIAQLHDTVTALESAAAHVLESQRPKVETQDESGEGGWKTAVVEGEIKDD